MSATEKQIKFANKIAQSLGEVVPDECFESHEEMSRWIDEHLPMLEKDEDGKAVFKPSEKQAAFAERIARVLGAKIPQDCFTNSRKLSAWIDDNVEEYREASKQAAGPDDGETL